MISQATTVAEFLATLPAGERKLLGQVRTLFRKAHPKVEESMKYRMPTYLVGDEHLGAFNRQKNYFALYLGGEVLDPHRKELKAAGLDCGGGCLRFRRPEQLPLPLVARMIKAKAGSLKAR